MKMSINFPVFINYDGDGEFDIAFEAVKAVIKFDSEEVKQRQKEVGDLDTLDYVAMDVMRDTMGLVYSPLMLGKVLNKYDKEIVFEVFSYIENLYQKNPAQFLGAAKYQMMKKKKSLPKSLDWELMKSNYSDCYYGNIEEDFFTEWKMHQENALILSHVSHISDVKSASLKTRKI